MSAEEADADGESEAYQVSGVLSPERAGERTRVVAYRAVCDRHGWAGGIVRESKGFARQDAERHNRMRGHDEGTGASVREVDAVRIGSTLRQVEVTEDV